MTTQSKESIMENLDLGLQNRVRLQCILKNGLPESKNSKDDNPVLYHRITFKPDFEFDGWYSGHMYYPDNEDQGIMDFNANSFLSVLCQQG